MRPIWRGKLGATDVDRQNGKSLRHVVVQLSREERAFLFMGTDQALAQVTQLILHLFAIRDVAKNTESSDHTAGGIALGDAREVLDPLFPLVRMKKSILEGDLGHTPVVQLFANAQHTFAVRGMQMFEPELQDLKTEFLFGRNATDVAHPVVDIGDAIAKANLVKPESGEVGARLRSHLGLENPTRHLLPIQRSGEQLAKHAETRDKVLRPLGFPFRCVEDHDVADDSPDLDRKREGRPDRHLNPLLTLNIRLWGKFVHAGYTNRHAFYKQLMIRPGEYRSEVDIRGYRRNPLGVGRHADVHDLQVCTHGKEGAAVDVEEAPDAFQGLFYGQVNLFRRSRKKRGGRIGNKRLELKTALALLGGGLLLIEHRHSSIIYNSVCIGEGEIPPQRNVPSPAKSSCRADAEAQEPIELDPVAGFVHSHSSGDDKDGTSTLPMSRQRSQRGIRLSRMRFLFPILLCVLLVALGPRAAKAQTIASDSTSSTAVSDSAVVAADSTAAQVPPRDIMDVLNERILHRPIKTELTGTLSTGLEWALLPSISYNPVYGLAVGATVSGAGRVGIRSKRYSQLSISGNYSTNGQIQAQVRGDMFSGSDNYLLKVDFRYLDTQRSTWGLGPAEAAQEEYPMDFKLLRAYATIYRRASGPVFIGLGYHYDEFLDIVDTRANAGESTPFVEYSGGAVARTVASGFSLNVLGDTRDNLVNPASGYYLSGSFRDFSESIGSDKNWQELWIEMRVYPHLPNHSQNVLGFWLYTWLTFGETPYLNLPSNGWDTNGRGARGYLQGRIRGSDQVYIESEYRRTLTRDGLFGVVAFLNATSTAEPETGVLGRVDWGGGVGLRVKFNKNSNTNLVIDHGWGRVGSKGFFFGMSETF